MAREYQAEDRTMNTCLTHRREGQLSGFYFRLGWFILLTYQTVESTHVVRTQIYLSIITLLKFFTHNLI